jgi:hypothetical protein
MSSMIIDPRDELIESLISELKDLRIRMSCIQDELRNHSNRLDLHAGILEIVRERVSEFDEAPEDATLQ